MLSFLLVGLGGALGSMARYAVTLASAAMWGESFPWGTILINVTGSFLIGWFATMTLPDGAAPASAELRVFVIVGICGGYTTFSSFSLQTLQLLRGGEIFGALANVLLSALLCIVAVALGAMLGRH